MRSAASGEMTSAHAAAQAQRHLVNRIILLGASNLTLSLNLAIRLVQQRCGAPSEVLIAAGHGRSYGMYSQVLVRGLPGIVDCGLWRHLEAGPDLPTYAFVTDVGNDIPYGHGPERILEWVGTCVERMRGRAAQIVMTNLPLKLIGSLSEARFRIMRTIFFPFSRLSRSQVVRGAEIVHRGLRELADRGQVQLCDQPSDWFGPDIIHILYWKRRKAYTDLFHHFAPAGAAYAPAGDGPRATGRGKRPRFACQTLFGRERRCSQPSGRLADGTMISMY